MIKGYSEEITKIYEDIREKENNALRVRRKEISERYPQIIKLEQEIGKLCVELSLSFIRKKKSTKEDISLLRKKIEEQRIKKCELLVSFGYSQDFLDLHYQCPKCKDSGYLGTKRCSCYKPKLIKLYYKNSDLKEMLRINNFDNFNLDLFPKIKTAEEPESPRKNMEKIASKAWQYIKSFNKDSENLLFYGNSGTGKTFLSHCIAKELLDKGYFVVYRTAEDLIQNIRSIKIDGNKTLEELLLDCDLLIIDDLGTEQLNNFTKTELFNILNKKLILGKKMLISTNFTIENLSKTYSERITSRLFGNFTLCKFYGEDIRVKKNLSKID